MSAFDWHDQAACRGEDRELFFAPEGERQVYREHREREALKVCARCPVRRTCLEWALKAPEKDGVWGGATEEERAAERRRRRWLAA